MSNRCQDIEQASGKGGNFLTEDAYLWLADSNIKFPLTFRAATQPSCMDAANVSFWNGNHNTGVQQQAGVCGMLTRDLRRVGLQRLHEFWLAHDDPLPLCLDVAPKGHSFHAGQLPDRERGVRDDRRHVKVCM